MLGDQSFRDFNIGLSGAVPERSTWFEPALDRAILEFISFFVSLVFKHGGQIVHGSHPTFTPIILKQAKRHVPTGGKSVILFISELWARLQENRDLFRHYADICKVYVVKQVGDGNYNDITTRNNSLRLMRHHLIQRMNVVVAVGGMLHDTGSIKPGVLEEVELATTRQIACFLVGGMGGMTGKLAGDSLWESKLRNYLAPEVNEELLSTRDVAACAGILVSHLMQHPQIAWQKLSDLEINKEDCLEYEKYLRDGFEERTQFLYLT